MQNSKENHKESSEVRMSRVSKNQKKKKGKLKSVWAFMRTTSSTVSTVILWIAIVGITSIFGGKFLILLGEHLLIGRKALKVFAEFIINSCLNYFKNRRCLWLTLKNASFMEYQIKSIYQSC